MFYIGILAPDNNVIKAEGGSLRLALERLRNNWNDHYTAKRPPGMLRLATNTDFDGDQFLNTLSDSGLSWIMTTHKTSIDCFLDTVADENGPRPLPV